jgi:hypothetical protein
MSHGSKSILYERSPPSPLSFSPQKAKTRLIETADKFFQAEANEEVKDKAYVDVGAHYYSKLRFRL